MTSPRSPRRCRAFSLIELLIATLIMGIIASIVAPRWNRTSIVHRVNAASRKIKHDLHLIRQLALDRTAIHTATFDSSTDTYVLVGHFNPDRPAKSLITRLAEQPYEVDVISVELPNAGDEQIEFDGLGMPDSNGSIVIGIGIVQKEIAIESSGRITISNYIAEASGDASF